jgi:hypothetical protein
VGCTLKTRVFIGSKYLLRLAQPPNCRHDANDLATAEELGTCKLQKPMHGLSAWRGRGRFHVLRIRRHDGEPKVLPIGRASARGKFDSATISPLATLALKKNPPWRIFLLTDFLESATLFRPRGQKWMR